MKRDQRGELNLWWCAILVGIVTALAFAGLFSMRYERNLFAEGLAYVKGAPVAASLQRAQSEASDALKGADAALRKCTINGAVVYSNVDCRADNPTSRMVEVHVTRGIEAPKAPPTAAPASSRDSDSQQKALDKAMRNQAE